MQTLNKLSRNHDPAGEPALRTALQAISASNVGGRIELFVSFLYEERERFRREGKSLRSAAFPGSGPWLISLFAYWLDAKNRPYILYPSLLHAVKLLLDAGAVPRPEGLRIDNDAVEVQTDLDYQAIVRAIESLRTAVPGLVAPGLEGYWAEAFLSWLAANPDVLKAEASEVYEPLADTILLHTPLPATPEALLRRLIAELRGAVLIEEELVRRIYHALLAGNVILSGPPGTGKTELARRVPELLWQSEVIAGASTNPLGSATQLQRVTSSAFATRLVTATDEWSVRTLIGGLAPISEGGKPTYRIQYGHLTQALFANWAISESNPLGWSAPQRKSVRAPSYLSDGDEREFRGCWLVIDEFNRAPIDLALGEALTALGGSGRLRVPVDGGSEELPIPQDFRIIGTLNSFDRNYLNQLSEALKRRFAFIEIPPPTRQRRQEEQAIVLAKAVASITHLSPAISPGPDDSITWPNVVSIARLPSGSYSATWATPSLPLATVFGFVWNVFEIIRIYRQLGTAQAIALVRQMLIAGVVQNLTSREDWVKMADLALCDTIADQLQVLLPDELEVIIGAHAAGSAAEFTAQLNGVLLRLLSSPRRFAAQASALNSVVDKDGNQIVRLDEDAEQYSDQNPPTISEAHVVELFHWQNKGYDLPSFTRRLRAFKLERGL